MLPLNKDQRSEDVRLAKDRMNETYGLKLDLEGANPAGALYDEALKAAVKDHLIKFTGDKSGDRINANMWNGLLKDFIIKVAPAGTKGDKGDRGSDGSRGAKGDQGIQGDPGQRGLKGADGKAVTLKITADTELP